MTRRDVSPEPRRALLRSGGARPSVAAGAASGARGLGEANRAFSTRVAAELRARGVDAGASRRRARPCATRAAALEKRLFLATGVQRPGAARRCRLVTLGLISEGLAKRCGFVFERCLRPRLARLLRTGRSWPLLPWLYAAVWGSVMRSAG